MLQQKHYFIDNFLLSLNCGKTENSPTKLLLYPQHKFSAAKVAAFMWYM